MSRFLVLGAGFVAEPVLEYLLRKPTNQVSVASHILSEAESLANKFEQAKPLQVDVSSEAELKEIIKSHDVVVSLVPAPLHPMIAQACISEQRSMITASYESDFMKEINEEAKAAGIVILNEIGLDPGIDHLSAMKIIHEAQEKGEKIRSFVSWCGGLPAPEFNDNPLGYKFSWAPKGVLQALSNEAVYLRKNKVETVESRDLLRWSEPLSIAGMALEGYPNRESTSYQSVYGIPEAENILRGTLRYSGFSVIIQAAKSLGLLRPESNSSDLTLEAPLSWKQYLQALNQGNFEQKLDSLRTVAREGIEWLGCLSETEQPNLAGRSRAPLDVFCELLTEKLAYHEGEKDMVVLQHKFEIERADSSRYFLQSTLVAYGDPINSDPSVRSYTAMSKTVGYPVAIASQLIAEGVIKAKGVVLPVTPEIYIPMLESLEKEGIECTEQEIQDKGFLKELT